LTNDCKEASSQFLVVAFGQTFPFRGDGVKVRNRRVLVVPMCHGEGPLTTRPSHSNSAVESTAVDPNRPFISCRQMGRQDHAALSNVLDFQFRGHESGMQQSPLARGGEVTE
jgi:hypothetical protein